MRRTLWVLAMLWAVGCGRPVSVNVDPTFTPPPVAPGPPVAGQPAPNAVSSGPALPEDALDRLVAAAQRGDFETFRAGLARESREPRTAADWTRLKAEDDPDWRAVLAAWGAVKGERAHGGGMRVTHEGAILRYGDAGRELVMVVEDGGWKVLDFE